MSGRALGLPTRRVSGPFLAAVAAVLALAGLLSARAASAGPDAPLKPWERDVVAASEDLDRQIESAKQRNALGAVVQKCASRVSRDPTPLNRYLLGRALYHNGDPAGAAAQMRLALQDDPEFWFAYVKLAMLQADLKAWAEADKNLDEALKRKPGNLEALKVRTLVAVQRQDWAAARRAVSEVLDAEPGNLGARRDLLRFDANLDDWPALERDARLLLSGAPNDREARYFLAMSYLARNRAADARAELESLDTSGPPDARVLDLLKDAYAAQKEWDRVRATLERMLPFAKDEESRGRMLKAIETLKKGPPPEASPAAPRPPTVDELYAAMESKDAKVRREALTVFLQGIESGAIPRIEQKLWRRLLPDVEPEASCRLLVLQVLRFLSSELIPVAALALYDPDREVRLAACESLTLWHEPLAFVYLWPLLDAGAVDLVEFSAIRKALAASTGFRDLAAGPDVGTEEAASAVRDAWRRWNASDASVEPKLRAIRQMAAAREGYREWHLHVLAMDGHFEVMREAYLAMRPAVDRPARDPVEKKMLPLFPRVPDAEVTRETMRSLQDRLARWRADWVAEQRALARAKGPTPPNADGK